MGQSLGESLPTLRALLQPCRSTRTGFRRASTTWSITSSIPARRPCCASSNPRRQQENTAIAVTSAAMRACGGAAFAEHMAIERLFRDAHAGAVMAPTGDVSREFIGKAVLRLPLF